MAQQQSEMIYLSWSFPVAMQWQRVGMAYLTS